MRLRTRQDLQECRRIDLQANGVRRWSFAQRYRRPEVHFLRLLRRVEYLRDQSGPVARVIRFYATFRFMQVSVRTGLSIPPGVFGPGLSIAHYGSIVVNSRARVGSYCRIQSATNIGMDATGVPVVGDYVFIGPGAVLYGGITVGSRAVIGANSVVGRDVPAGVTVAGAPARQISDCDSSSVMPAFLLLDCSPGAETPGAAADTTAPRP